MIIFNRVIMLISFSSFWLLRTFVLAEAAENTPAPAVDPLIAIHDGFVEEKKCISCHADQATAFVKSQHAKAMAVADSTTVRADFDDIRFQHNDSVTIFFRRAERFFIRTEGGDGKTAEFEVKYTFAYEPLQQYLVDIGGGRLQALDIAWDTERKNWFWLGAEKRARPGTTYHWTGPFYRWNRNCIDCHSTDPRANFQPEMNTYKPSYVATSIGCQSCHGGGEKHVAWAEAASPEATSVSAPGVGLESIDAGMCFACHSRRTKLLDGHQPGKPFLDYFSPALLRSELYYPDGQIRDEVFEYGSFEQSKMARAGVNCLDCHSAHEAGLKAEGNALCTQCHAQTTSRRFIGHDPSGSFDTPEHTHHPIGSAGAECVNCHMPKRTYMKVDPRRDHSFVVPRPDLSMAYGTPNACTNCHENQTDGWAVQRLDEWYGSQWRTRPTTAHAFASAERNDPDALTALRKITEDEDQAGIIRGSSIAEMGRIGGAEVVADVVTAAKDSDPLVRLGAAEAAVSLPSEVRVQAIGGLLADETRAVRLAAIKALGRTPSLGLSSEGRAAFEAAVEDLRGYVDANVDVAEAQNTFGIFLLEQQRMEEAEATLRRAISLDPSFTGAHISLAELHRVAGQNDKSEKAYAEAIVISPDEPSLRYGHALALVREKKMDAAIQESEKAVRLSPENSIYRTTFAIALDSVGRTNGAFLILGEVIVAGSTDLTVLRTAIQFGLKLRRYPETLKHAEALARLQPQTPRLEELIRYLKDMTATSD